MEVHHKYFQCCNRKLIATLLHFIKKGKKKGKTSLLKVHLQLFNHISQSLSGDGVCPVVKDMADFHCGKLS